MRRAQDPRRQTTCKSCGASVYWAETKNGKRMPLDAEPVNNGQWLLFFNERLQILKTRKVTKNDDPYQNRYDSHFATCPNAKNHRKR